jgi:hypothetical protein
MAAIIMGFPRKIKDFVGRVAATNDDFSRFAGMNDMKLAATRRGMAPEKGGIYGFFSLRC